MENKKVVTLEDRVPKIRELRKQKANRRLVLYLSLFFILLSLILYSQSSLSKVSNITVSGLQYVTKEEIIHTSEIETGVTSFWSINKKDITKKLEEREEIKSASLEKTLPNKIVIEVTEYKRIAYILDDGDYIPVLENGKVLSSATLSILPHDAPLMIGWTDQKRVDDFINELMELPEPVIYSISEIHFTPNETDNSHISLYMNDGFEVSATIRGFASKMAAYPSIVAQLDPEQKGIINIEVGVFFKPYVTDGEELDNES